MDKYEELQTAKSNVTYLLDHEAALVDVKGIAYWAGVVERLRQEIKETL